jgi:hypothetical protein
MFITSRPPKRMVRARRSHRSTAFVHLSAVDELSMSKSNGGFDWSQYRHRRIGSAGRGKSRSGFVKEG